MQKQNGLISNTKSSHSTACLALDCEKPVTRNALGRLLYDLKLRAPEMRKKKVQSFTEAAAESFGSGSSASSKQSRGSVLRSENLHHTGPKSAPRREEEEVISQAGWFHSGLLPNPLGHSQP
jgi:hypothetical protein